MKIQKIKKENEMLKSQKRTRDLFMKIIRKSLKRPEKLTVSEWAEKYRILSDASYFKGKWSNDITPYLVGIMDAFNDPYIEEINFCKSTQVGGTEAMLNMLGWIILQNPSPAMIVYPNDDLAKEVSNERIKPSLLQTPQIADCYYVNSSKELKLKFKGSTIYLNGSNSDSKLASRAIRYLFFDEIDKMSGASAKEASPYNLAKERTRTYTHSRKIYTCSTPTLKDNYVWKLHEAAEKQFNYFVPCPQCRKKMIFEFNQIKYSQDKNLTNVERTNGAYYECPYCKKHISDYEKIGMLKKGEWIDVKNECIGHVKTVSFWINALYSRFLTWAEIALEFLKSKDDPEQLQNFKNSWLAEPWEDVTASANENIVLERQTHLEEKILPSWTKFITAGVDIQKDSIYWTIRAWGGHITSQNIAHGHILSFEELEAIMNTEYVTEDGKKLLVSLALIDSGHRTDEVYEFCVINQPWALPCKGASHPLISYYTRSIVNKIDSKANGIELIILDTGKYKDIIYSRMKRPTGYGSWMVYKDCDYEYAKQVTSEHKIIVKGKKEKIWVTKTTHTDNHYLDCEVYAFGAADLLGIRTVNIDSEVKK